MIPIRDHLRAKSFPFVTVAFVVANGYVFVRQLLLAQPEASSFTMEYAFIAERFLETPVQLWYTPLTSLFFHGGFIHFVGNMLFLVVFGDNVEDALGHVRYFFFYLLAGLVSLAAQTVVSPDLSIPVIGASGSISAVLGAYLILFPLARVTTIIPVGIFLMPARLPAVVFLFVWAAVQFFSGYLSIVAGPMDNVAYLAHVGGFVFGVVVALAGRRRYLAPFKRRGIYGREGSPRRSREV